MWLIIYKKRGVPDDVCLMCLTALEEVMKIWRGRKDGEDIILQSVEKEEIEEAAWEVERLAGDAYTCFLDEGKRPEYNK